MRHPGEGETPGLARLDKVLLFLKDFASKSNQETHFSWIVSRGGLKFTKSSERPKVRLEHRKSADADNRINMKTGAEEVKGNEEEGRFSL